MVECHGSQCGFCTPGVLMSAKALLDANPDPTEEEIRNGISGNLCRCTGYVKIIQSIKEAVLSMKGGTRNEQKQIFDSRPEGS
jgi:carbon-monoxide dehydrogenase small subunit